MNKVILIGRLCTDVDLRHTNSGTAVANYRLAVDRQFKKEGQPEADFLNCVAWGNNAEFADKYLNKGMKIAVEGHIQTRSYDGDDGKKVYITEIVVEHHEFCEKKTDSSGTVSEQAPTYSPYNVTPIIPAPTGGFSTAAAQTGFEEVLDESDLPF